jgi:hypothetical protein
MDLTKYDFDNTDSGSESQTKIEPGVHTLNFDGYEVVTGRNNWEAIKVFFTVGSSTFRINHAFTVGHDNPDVVRRGKHSFKAMATAMGLGSLTSMDKFMDKSVVAPVIMDNDDKYMVIDENFGKNWQPATESVAKPKPKVEDDNIKTGPSDSDLAAMGTTVASEDDAPF